MSQPKFVPLPARHIPEPAEMLQRANALLGDMQTRRTVRHFSDYYRGIPRVELRHVPRAENGAVRQREEHAGHGQRGDQQAVVLARRRGAHEPRVVTFSMHCESNFPSQKQRSDRDVALPAGLDDDGYLEVLERELGPLLASVGPDLVFFNAGVDPHGEDRLGRRNRKAIGFG